MSDKLVVKFLRHNYVNKINFLLIILYAYDRDCILHVVSLSRYHIEQDAREAMRVFFSVLTKRICMHKTNFLRIYSNIV